MTLFSECLSEIQFRVMYGIAFRLSIVCYDRLFSRKCCLYRLEWSDYFSKPHVDVFSIFFFVLNAPPCLGRVSGYYETPGSDRSCSMSIHICHS